MQRQFVPSLFHITIVTVLFGLKCIFTQTRYWYIDKMIQSQTKENSMNRGLSYNPYNYYTIKKTLALNEDLYY